jgi:alcohol dehydrogenase (cytochrome c)
MPPGASTSLSVGDHASVVAYILQNNGYTPGTTTLALGSKGLDEHFLWAGKYQSSYGRSDQLAAVASRDDFISGDSRTGLQSDGPDQAALNGASNSTEWLIHSHDYAGTRYSPLNQINVDNASRLAPACVFQMGETGNFQTGPIVYKGVMYLTTRTSTVAIDAATCKPKWKQTWTPRGDTVWERNRGVAIKDGYLVRGTPDGYLVAMNSQTGGLIWARRVAKAEAGETFTMAPIIYEDLVLIGPAGSENNIQGWVGAFRLRDGSSVWRFNTVPKKGEAGFETWKDPKGIPMGGGAIWTSFSLDTETGDLHVAVTNPSPDLPVHLRQGSNLYTNSIVVLDVRTGKLRWHNQLVPNDSHDWDLTHASPIFNTTVNGVARRFVTTAGKDGFLRVLDRDTREVVYTTAVTTIENANTPITTKPTRACPGVLGGVEWNGPAYNAGLNMLYVPAVDWCTTFTAFEEPRYIPGRNYMGGTVTSDPTQKSQGWIIAIDASNGAVKWKYRSPRPMVAAVTTTGGNLLFTGALGGDFLALDARTGREVYRFNTGGSIGGGVVTYAAGGKQYVAVASGSPSNFWVDQYPGAPTIVIFALPRE